MTPAAELLMVLLSFLFFLLGFFDRTVKRLILLSLATGFFVLSSILLAGGENAELGLVCLGMGFLSGAITAVVALQLAAGGWK
ncbi:MAG: hypothetical protein QW356_06065 [Candidatus Hadarchaeales archaeon]